MVSAEPVAGLSSLSSLSSLPPTALHGLAGRVVEAVDPYTEADPAAVLVSFLVAFGSSVGPAPHLQVGAEAHRANLFAILVGRSSKARKGSSWSPVRALFDAADPSWCSTRIVSGLGSGEGLVFAVRDATTRDGEVIDPGEPDKRALVLATEFVSVLRVAARQGSTLSPVLRDAWDRGDLRVTTKNSPLRATGAHVSILAHVTETELRRELTDTEAASGFGNRFLWVNVERSKLLPEPEPFDASTLSGLTFEVRRTLEEARQRGRLTRDPDARTLWRRVYPHLSRDRYGLAGSLLDRAEAQVTRLQLLYALLDRSDTVRGEHLQAALDLWQHLEDGAERMFGTATGDPVADAIEEAVRTRGVIDRTTVHALFDRHVDARRIDTAVQLLVSAGRVREDRAPTGGRPSVRLVPAK